MLKSNKPTKAGTPIKINIFGCLRKTLKIRGMNIPRHFFDHAVFYMLLLWIIRIALSLVIRRPTDSLTIVLKSVMMTAVVGSSIAIAVVPIVYTFHRGKNHFLRIIKSQSNLQYLELRTKYYNTTSGGTLSEQYRRLLKQYHTKVRKGRDLLGAWLCSLVPALLIGLRISDNILHIQHHGNSKYQVVLIVLGAICGYTIILASFYLLLKIGRIIRISGWYIRTLTKTFHLTMIPDHADGCAGLSKLGKLCIVLLWPVILGLGIAIAYVGFAFVAFRYGLDLNRYSQVNYLVISALILMVYVIPSLTWGIILPVRAIHKHMQQQKEQSLVNESEVLQQLYHARIDAIQQKNWTMVEQQRQYSESIKDLYSPLPTWPFKFRVLLKAIFLTLGNAIVTAIPATILAKLFNLPG